MLGLGQKGFIGCSRVGYNYNDRVGCDKRYKGRQHHEEMVLKVNQYRKRG